jgi:hypothetical protein
MPSNRTAANGVHRNSYPHAIHGGKLHGYVEVLNPERRSLERDSHDPEYVLHIIPKRKEKSLLLGDTWVDAKTYRIRQIRALKGDIALASRVPKVLLVSTAAPSWLRRLTKNAVPEPLNE